MAQRTFTEIVNSMITFIRGRIPNLDTKAGTYTRDVVIDGPGNEMATIETAIETAKDAQSPTEALEADLVVLAEMWNVFRQTARTAAGTVTFYATSGASSVAVPAGTSISTLATGTIAAQIFTTDAEVTLEFTSAFFNPNTERYEVDAAVTASKPGVAGNVASTTISQVSMSGIDGVTNEDACTGGQDQESIVNLRTRLLRRLTGNNVGTVDGYANLLTDTTVSDAVEDVYVIGAGDTLMTRQEAGAVDLFVKGSTVTTIANESHIYTVGQSTYIMTNQPVVGVDSVYADTTALIEGVDYNVSWDLSTNYGGSTLASTAVVLTASAGSPAYVYINYRYNSLIATLDTEVEKDEYHIVGVSELVKWAFEVSINITVSIVVLAGYSSTSVASNVSTALTTALNLYGIGDDVQEFDMLAIIDDVEGVDDARSPFTLLQGEYIDETLISVDANNNLSIPANAVAVPGTIRVTVTT